MFPHNHRFKHKNPCDLITCNHHFYICTSFETFVHYSCAHTELVGVQRTATSFHRSDQRCFPSLWAAAIKTLIISLVKAVQRTMHTQGCLTAASNLMNTWSGLSPRPSVTEHLSSVAEPSGWTFPSHLPPIAWWYFTFFVLFPETSPQSVCLILPLLLNVKCSA